MLCTRASQETATEAGHQAGLDVFAVTDEAREGAAAFAEKRKPDFTTH